MSATKKSVVVIGAGALGAFTALNLIKEGCDVTIVGQRPYGPGASWRSFAWLNANSAVPAAYHHLRTLSVSRYHDLALHPRLGRAVSFSGMLAYNLPEHQIQVVQGATDVETLDASYPRLRDLGHAVEMIDREHALRLEPLLAPTALPNDGILWTSDEGWVELPALIGDVLAEFVALGGTYVSDDEGASVVTSGGRATGAQLSDGTVIPADAVVVTAGAASPALLAQAGITVPASTNIAVLIVTQPTALRPRRMIRTPWGTLRPDAAGRTVIHSTFAEDSATRDGDTVTADPDTIATILASMSEQYLPGVGPLQVDRIASGLRPIPGDGLSVVGAVPGLDGAFMGFTHSGATLSPVIGELLAHEIATGVSSPLLADFGLGRFA